MIQRRRSRGIAASALLIGVVFAAACGPGTAPVGQPPMVTLTEQGLEQLREDFNRASGDTRLVLLLSPT